MSSPPTGTVTFLFTDIEGSTQLVQQHASKKNRLLFVSYHEREIDVVRIISARLATKEERRRHEKKER